MKQLVAFIQKEFMEIVRNSKLLICGIIFALLGIMNPAIAKMTPWIMEMYSETSSSGIVFQKVEVTALTSWEQFYKNMPIGIIVFVLMFSGIVAAELQKGTLINIVTKGMSRWKIMISKFIMMLVLFGQVTTIYLLFLQIPKAAMKFLQQKSSWLLRILSHQIQKLNLVAIILLFHTEFQRQTRLSIFLVSKE